MFKNHWVKQTFRHGNIRAKFTGKVSKFFFYRWKAKLMFDVDHPVRSGLTLLEFWQSVLPEEASGHHQRQHEEEHQAQLRPFHLHPAAFGESFELDGRSGRSSRSRSLLYGTTENT